MQNIQQEKRAKTQLMPRTPDVYILLRDELQKGANGQVLQNRTNYLRIFTKDRAFQNMFQFNEFSQNIELAHSWWKREQQNLTDHDLDNISFYLEGYGMGRGQEQLMSAIRIIAHERNYHPVLDYLNQLSPPQDGIDYVGEFLPKFLGVAPGSYQRECFKLFGLQAVERVHHPGAKADYSLVLIGGQGIGKSSTLEFLAHNPNWFTDSLPRLNNDHVAQFLWGTWIVELAEGSSLRGVATDDIKAFLSRQRDRYKEPYARFAHDYSRQCVFALTTNEADALPLDYTGNRRFLPIICGEGGQNPRDNPEETERYVNGFWAQIMETYKSGDFQLYPSDKLSEQLRQKQQLVTPEDGEAGKIFYWLSEEYQGDYVCSMQIIDRVFDGNIQGNSRRIGRIMDNLVKGWERTSTLIDFGNPYGRQRAWRRICSAEHDTEHRTEMIQNDTELKQNDTEQGFIPLSDMKNDTELPFS